MNIQLLEAAQQELDEAIEWYAKQAQRYAKALGVTVPSINPKAASNSHKAG